MSRTSPVSSRIASSSVVAQEVTAAVAAMLVEEDAQPKEKPAKKKMRRTAASILQARKRKIKAIVNRSMNETHDFVFSDNVDPAAVQLFTTIHEMVQAKREEFSGRKLELLVEAMLPANDPMGAVHSKIELDNAKARVKFLEEVRCLTSSELADMAGHGAQNRSVTASRWKSERKVFSVSARRQELYPAFQFRDGKPDPAIAQILSELPSKMTAWQIAFWFVSSNSWLDGRAPQSTLDDPAAAIAAARHLNEVPAG
ncbi:hypothetical protein [Mesorhizobium sp. CAU 1741]|uniref:hypothetical protein n=1 Tax=Mesorhizobium sp. CAU 1741 TaxID=3140366 RepID=UPI00325A8414